MLTRSAPSFASPGFAGRVLVGDAHQGTRQVTISGVLDARTVAGLRAAENAFKARLAVGTIGLSVQGSTGIEIRARLRSLLITPGHPPLAALVSQVEATLEAVDPYAYDVVPTVIALSSAAAACPLGVHPSAPVIRIMNATDPVATVRGASGEPVASIAITITQATDEDYIVIDCERQRILEYDAGAESDITAAVSAGDFFALDPLDGDRDNDAWPTLELSSGTGEAVYRRAW
jgi:hypothetical protein